MPQGKQDGPGLPTPHLEGVPGQRLLNGDVGSDAKVHTAALRDKVHQKPFSLEKFLRRDMFVNVEAVIVDVLSLDSIPR
jgi:hypothetical protein